MGTLLNRRRYMGGKALPYDAEIKYLEAVSGCKIVTDIYFDSTTEYTCTFYFGNITARTLFSGVFGDNMDGYWAIGSNGCVENTYNTSSVVNVQNGFHTFVRALNVKTCDGGSIQKNTNADNGWFSHPTYPLTFFSYQYNRDGQCSNIRFVSAIVKKNNVIVADYIPVRKGQVGYTYDRVSGKLFGNNGTGSFILGPDREIIMTSESNPEVLAICYAQGWCANPNYMYKDEAEAVTNIGSYFKGTNITHFEELQYFGITSLYQTAFQDCTSLASIVLPTTVSSLGQRAFQGCTALTAITIPSLVTTFPNYLFRDCTALETVIKGSITWIGADCFRGCSALTSYTFDSGLTLIGSAAFYNTQNIVFTNDIPSTVTAISSQAFQSTGFTGKLTIPSGITTLNQSVFNGTKCSEIVLPSTITTIGQQALASTSNLDSLTCYATTPPDASAYNVFYRFGKTGTVIYVPSGSVESYKTADGWSTVASKIQAIPT